MKNPQMANRIKDAVAGKLPMEELTAKELKKLEKLVFNAVLNKLAARVVPTSNAVH